MTCVRCIRDTAPESLLCALLLVAVPLAAGCGDSLPADRAVISGVVLVDGERPASGSITLRPVDGTSPTAGGAIQGGNYNLVASRGVSSVAIRVPKVVGFAKAYNTPESPSREVRAESLPPRYNDETELTVELMHGENTINFELTTE